MIPALGKAGVYEVQSPYQLSPDTSYTCRAISYIQSLVDKDIDVYNEYYVSVGLTETEYNRDIDKDEAIVTLKSDDNVILNIPSSYILSVPIDEEVPYSRFAVLFEFGTLPNETAFENLVESMKDISKTSLGVEPNASLAVLPYDGFVTKTQHKVNLQARQVNISYSKSPRLKLLEALTKIQSQAQRIEALEEVIIKLNP